MRIERGHKQIWIFVSCLLGGIILYRAKLWIDDPMGKGLEAFFSFISEADFFWPLVCIWAFFYVTSGLVEGMDLYEDEEP